MRRLFVGVAIALAGAMPAGPASAHPAGSTSVNRYLGISCTADRHVQLAYLLDFAELPAYAEIESLDADHDGSVTPAEQAAYLARRVPPLVARWTVEIDGVRVTPRVTGSSLEVLPGDRGLSTLRIAVDVAADPAAATRATGDLRVHVVDPVFADRSGWRQMAAEASPGTTVVGGPALSPSAILSYGNSPDDAPPRVDDAVFVFRARSAGDAASDGDGSTTWRVLVAAAIALVAALAAGVGYARLRRR